MDQNEHLILIRSNTSAYFEDETYRIEKIQYAQSEEKYYVKYSTKNENPAQFQEIPYPKKQVKYFTEPQKLSIHDYIFYLKGELLTDISSVLVFGNEYYKIFHSTTVPSCHHYTTITTKEHSLVHYKNLIDYLREVMYLDSLYGKNNKPILLNSFNNLRVYPDCALEAYLANNGAHQYEQSQYSCLIFPFGCNESQRNAVEMCIMNNISIIEGPPGTGKTQTILNIIANLVIRKKTVAVISSNNSAVDNVAEKLDSQGLEYIYARLGSAEHKRAFIQNLAQYSNQKRTYKHNLQHYKNMCRRADEYQRILKDTLHLFNDKAVLEDELYQLKLEEQYFRETLQKAVIPNELKHLSTTKVIFSHIYRLEHIVEKRSKKKVVYSDKIPFLYKLLYRFYYKLGDWNTCKNLNDIFSSLRLQFYIQREQDINSELMAVEKELQQVNMQETLKKLQETSMEGLKGVFTNTFPPLQIDIKEIKELNSSGKQILSSIPVLLSTTFSLPNCYNGVLFDYVIIDEASQNDLLTGILATSMAKNICIIGDQNQLQNIVKPNIKKELQKLETKYEIDSRFCYSENSFLSSVQDMKPKIPTTILREHYRCYPKIINFCNHMFYRGQMIPLRTNPDETQVLLVQKTVNGNHARGRYNQRQIDEIKKLLPTRLAKDSASQIGIITPYNPQKDKTNEMLKEKEISGVSVSTIHKFQGREKKSIIISTVDNKIGSFVNDAHMINVAVSRAEDFLCVVISNDEANTHTLYGELVRYIEYQGGEIRTGVVRSIFDMLYKGYENALRQFLKLDDITDNMVLSEKICYQAIKNILNADDKRYSALSVAHNVPLSILLDMSEVFTKNNIDTYHLTERHKEFAMNPCTHIDFVISMKTSKQFVLAIEVDGVKYHARNKIQQERDDLKDTILLAATGRKPLRLRTDGSNERQRIKQDIEDLLMTQQYKIAIETELLHHATLTPLYEGSDFITDSMAFE